MREYPKFVRFGCMSHVPILDRLVIQCDPCADHFIGSKWPLRQVSALLDHVSRVGEQLTRVDAQRLSQSVRQRLNQTRILCRTRTSYDCAGLTHYGHEVGSCPAHIRSRSQEGRSPTFDDPFTLSERDTISALEKASSTTTSDLARNHLLCLSELYRRLSIERRSKPADHSKIQRIGCETPRPFFREACVRISLYAATERHRTLFQEEVH